MRESSMGNFAVGRLYAAPLDRESVMVLAETRDQVTRIARSTARLIGVQRELAGDEVELDERYHAGTYGIPDAATIAAIETAARTEGMITDPVYEGKSMAALIDLVRDGRIEPGSRVLYAHLGGQPALNAYSSAF